MIRRTCYCFIFTVLVAFGNVQSAFAEFNIEVVNKSGKAYENVALVIKAVGFIALYGRISLGKIGADPTPKYFSYEYKYGNIPLTQLSMSLSLEEYNLDMFVLARPTQPTGILEREFKNIVTAPEIISEEEPIKYKNPMQGIRPPYIRLIITGVTRDNPAGIEAEFE
jgi:hypothetical protein